MPSLTGRIKLTLVLGLGIALCCLHWLPGELSVGAVTPQSAAGGDEFFEKKVRPILINSCAKCHNPKAMVAGLDLTTGEGFRRGGDSGPLLDSEHPAKSRLLQVVGYEEKLKMPPAGKLRSEEIESLVEWVRMGAPWPGVEAPVVASLPPRSGRDFTTAERNFWSFQPLSRFERTNSKSDSNGLMKEADWANGQIDRFILAGLSAKGLPPSKPADRLTLLRRATFDLTGLPPTESEIRAFLADHSAEAFSKVIDRLLASPRYGEKWGRHWLDVARYADSTGNDEDHRYPHAWRYRDYVIDAFNQDLPYHQFVREQVAGDLLPAEDGSEVNRRGIIATGLLAIGPKALAQQDKARMLYDVYDEQVEVTGKAFLGLTISCARCHNHKFDPILTRDYYGLVSIFASTRSFRDPDAFVSQPLTKPLIGKADYSSYQLKLEEWKNEQKRMRLALESIIDARKGARIERLKSRLADYMLAARQVYHTGADATNLAQTRQLDLEVLRRWVQYLKPAEDPRQHLLAWHQAEDPAAEARSFQSAFIARLTAWQTRLSAWQEKYRAAIEAKTALPDRPVFVSGEDRFFAETYLEKKGPFSVDEAEKSFFSRDENVAVEQLRRQLEDHGKHKPVEPEMACAVEDGQRVNQRVFIRGDINNPGEDAPRTIPAILASSRPLNFGEGSGRRELAEWLTHPDNPLTARVMVNRVWLWHFGEGIVRTPDNFGKMGERPTNPELLDWLATEFIRSGWSIKALHRLIMLSKTYQMSSGISNAAQDLDPENRLFSRFPRRRLTVEEVRDGLLAIDGTLDLTMGGTLQSGTGTDGENDSKRLSLNPEKINRRSIYIPLRRANLPTLLNLFDFGDATAMSGKRQLTNIATQALFWMNSDFVTERTRGVANDLLNAQGAGDDSRVRSAYLRILNRQPSADEIIDARRYLSEFSAQLPTPEPVLAWQSLCRVLMASNEFIYLD
ncbi:MAG: DUF1553 domain-containing protein [Acidobacteria bacterium]|nr:DUF1553 domain-containing protein [Acidobacteriota bacterium]